MEKLLRHLTKEEESLLRRMFEANFDDRDLFRDQALESRVEEWEDGSGTLSFEIGFGATGPHWVPVEAEYTDSDGATVHVLLHIRDNRVYELEFYRDSQSDVRLRIPEPNELRLY
jgi:hypothetical protein